MENSPLIVPYTKTTAVDNISHNRRFHRNLQHEVSAAVSTTPSTILYKRLRLPQLQVKHESRQYHRAEYLSSAKEKPLEISVDYYCRQRSP